MLPAPPAAAQNVLINEIMFHPASHNLREQYVELYNAGATNVDVSGWKFTRGFQFTLPAGSRIPSSNFLAVVGHRQTFTNKYPGVTNYVGEFVFVRTTNVVGFTYTNFDNALSHSHETLQLEDAAGRVVDSLRYAEEGDWGIRQRGLNDGGYQGWRWFNDADGGGKSLELINPSLPNDHGYNWSPSTVTNGTPGAVNSVFSTNGPPLLVGVAHSPIVPRSTDTVAVTARVVDEAANPAVRLFWRPNGGTSPPAFASAVMLDDGAHGDGTTGDGIFGAFIPAQANLGIVEFYVEAVDASNKTNSWPRPCLDLNLAPLGHAANGLYQVDDTGPTNTAPYYKVVMTPAELAEFTALLAVSPGSDAAFNCTLISLDGQGTQVRYLAMIRNRGHGSRSKTPHNFWLGLPSDSTWKGVLALHLNAQKPHLQTFGAAFLLKSGATGNRSRAVQFRMNGGPGLDGPPTYTYYAANEAPSSDTADLRFPSDPGGNIYEVFRDNSPSEMNWRGSNGAPYALTYFKNSNTAENDYTDIVALHRILGTNDLWNVARARAVLNVEQWLTHLTAMAILNNTETGLNVGNNDDYQLYRGINDPRFVLVYHDLDSILGGLSSATLFGSLTGDVGAAMTRLLRTPPFELQYHQALQRLLDNTFAKTNFDALADQTLGFHVPAGDIAGLKTWADGRRSYVQGVVSAYFASNPPPPAATIAGEPRSPTPFTDAFLTVGGTNVASYRFKLNNGAYNAEMTVTTPIGLRGLANGSSNVVSVIGKSSAGAWQDTNSATASQFWIVNTATPAVRLNEVLAQNVTALNHAGTFPDAIELYNEGPAAVDLAGFHLSDDPANPFKFTFPSPAILVAGAYVVVYANPDDGTGGLHTGFALDAEGDSVYLADAAGALLDSVTFGLQLPDLSVGRFGASGEWKLCQPSFGATNVLKPTGVLMNVRINEWLASGVPPYVKDFVELFNAGAAPVDIGNSWLTDNPIGAPARHRLPPLTFIASNGFVKFTADGGAAPRHLGFLLSTVQGELGLAGPNLVPIESMIYGPQLPGVSQGRCPDGVNKVVSFTTPTPGAANACTIPAIGLRLNEVLANNQTLTEPDGSTPDWVEIYNGTNSTLNLADLSLSDDVANPRRWAFPANTLLPAASHLRVFFDADKPASATNTGFRLKAGGDAVYLFNGLASGSGLLDSIAFGVQAANFSIGRLPGGSGPWRLCVPTPAAPNVAAILGDPLQLKINEWLAHSASDDDAFEIYNPAAQPVALADLWLTDDLATPGTRQKHRIAQLSFIGTNVFGFQKFTADHQPQNGAEHVAFTLAAGGEALGLSQPDGTLIDGVTFGAQTADVPQGRLPDGSTHIVGFPSSESLGEANWLPLTNLVVNEILTHTDPPFEDAIEILNTSATSVTIAGWFLSNQKSNLKRFPITNSVPLPSGGFRVFYETQFNDTALAPIGFTLNAAHGGSVSLSQATNGVLTGYRAQVSFGAAANGVSFGRHRRSDDQQDFVAMNARTFGADAPATPAQFRAGTGLANAYPLVGPVVISEFLFQPPALGGLDNLRDEFIELRNLSSNAVALYDTHYPTNTWRLRGAVDVDFPANLTLAATGSIVVVSFDPAADPTALAAFLSAYGLRGALPVIGPWKGKLGNTGGTISLEKPDAVQLPPHSDAGFVPFVLVERISYGHTPPWPADASGTGKAVHRVSWTGYANDPTNWTAAEPTLVASAGGDSDGDGMPDAWERAHGLNPYANDAGGDADGDGMTNLQEYLAGTDPRDPGSKLVLLLSLTPAAEAQLQFIAASNVSYTLQHRASFSTGAWLTLQNIPAALTNRSIVITNTPRGTRFYRTTVP